MYCIAFVVFIQINYIINQLIYFLYVSKASIIGPFFTVIVILIAYSSQETTIGDSDQDFVIDAYVHDIDI